jgi:hypothetical protein
LTAQTTSGESTQTAIEKPTFGGRRVVIDSLNESMAAMRADDDVSARAMFENLLVMTLDGSGTVIHEGTHTSARMMNYCYWKDEYQLRWYVAVDMMGHILFVSCVYPGKVDDSEALKQTGFYEYAIGLIDFGFSLKMRARVYFTKVGLRRSSKVQLLR